MKKIKLKNIEIKYAVNSLLRKDGILASEDPDRRIPFSVIWKVDNNFRAMIPIYNEILKKQEKYVDGNAVNPLLQKEFNELMNEENEINIVGINFEEIKDCKLNGMEYQSIRFMLEGVEYCG